MPAGYSRSQAGNADGFAWPRNVQGCGQSHGPVHPQGLRQAWLGLLALAAGQEDEWTATLCHLRGCPQPRPSLTQPETITQDLEWSPSAPQVPSQGLSIQETCWGLGVQSSARHVVLTNATKHNSTNNHAAQRDGCVTKQAPSARGHQGNLRLCRVLTELWLGE